LTGRHRQLERIVLVARNTDHVIPRADVTVEAEEKPWALSGLWEAIKLASLVRKLAIRRRMHAANADAAELSSSKIG
jgi:hypothetical protein